MPSVLFWWRNQVIHNSKLYQGGGAFKAALGILKGDVEEPVEWAL